MRSRPSKKMTAKKKLLRARAHARKTATKQKPANKKGPTEVRPFERVWRLVRRIPRGRVATYGQLP